MMRARFARARWWRDEATLKCAPPPAGRRRPASTAPWSVSPAHNCPHAVSYTHLRAHETSAHL
eukprot:10619502-Alexandrium_andersonii.AAC.1